jgi:hypothetical protein
VPSARSRADRISTNTSAPIIRLRLPPSRTRSARTSSHARPGILIVATRALPCLPCAKRRTPRRSRRTSDSLRAFAARAFVVGAAASPQARAVYQAPGATCWLARTDEAKELAG